MGNDERIDEHAAWQGTLDHERLDAYRVAVELDELVARLARQGSRGQAWLFDQAQRASGSAVLNLAEAIGRDGADRARCLKISRGSALEVDAAMTLLEGIWRKLVGRRPARRASDCPGGGIRARRSGMRLAGARGMTRAMTSCRSSSTGQSALGRTMMIIAMIIAFGVPGGVARADVRLVGSSDLLAVIDRVEVSVYRADGRLVTRLPPGGPAVLGFDEQPGRQADERREQIFELHDIPTELRDDQEAEDLLDDELPLAQRRSRPRAEPEDALLRRPVVAAGAGGLWLGVDGVLYRIEPRLAPVRVGPLPRSVRFIAGADDGTLVLVSRDELLVSGDGGRKFQSLARLDREPAHLAIDPRRSWLAWADSSGVTVVRGSSESRLELPAVRDLQSCASDLVALAGDGLHVSSGGAALVRVSGPLPAKRIACPAAGDGPWLAVGEALLVSLDRGRTFRSRTDAPVGVITAAAFSHERIWLLSTAAGLTTLELAEAHTGASAHPDSAALPRAVVEPDLRRSRPPPWAAFALPRLTLAASYATTAGRRHFRALAVAELPLGRESPGLERPVLGSRQLAFLVEPAGSEPIATQPPSLAHPSPPAAISPAHAGPYPPGDPDSSCLAPVRARAVARAQAEPERARSLVARAGRAAWMPELRLRTEKRTGRSHSLDVRASNTSAGTSGRDAFGLDASNDVRYEVRVTWDLPRLIFSPDEVAAVQQASRMADMRREIEAQVNGIYFERRRLLVNPTGAPPVEATGALLRVEELEAELDTLSEGEFSRCRSARAPRLGP